VKALPRAFVLAPFDPEPTVVYEQLILPALEAAGYEVHRADDLGTHQNIIKDIVRSIEGAALVVADLTGPNPNVMYEVGLAHALGRPVVLVARKISEIPFDIRPYRAIPYSVEDDPDRLRGELEDIARRHLLGQVAFGNPITDFGKDRLSARAREALNIAELVRETVAAGRRMIAAMETIMNRAIEVFDQISVIRADLERATTEQRDRLLADVAALLKRLARDEGLDLSALNRAANDYYGRTERSMLVLDLAKPANLRDLERMRRSLIDSKKRFRALADSLRAARDNLLGLKSASDELDRAIEGMRVSLDSVMGFVAVSDAVVDRIVAIAEQRQDDAGQV
jgi:hypothetical protein